MSVINPKTGKRISTKGNVYKKLLSEGYVLINDMLTKPLEIKKNIESVSSSSSQKQRKIYTEKLMISNIINKKIDHIIHISDIHIPVKFITRKQEYLYVFDQLYNQLKLLNTKENLTNNNTVIVITGDLVHVKIKMESEMILETRNFLKELIKYYEVIIIAGNHDCDEYNINNIDNLTAIIDDIPKVYYLKNSGIYQYNNILFTVSSLVDSSKYEYIMYDDVNILDKTKYINIYLFHGRVFSGNNKTKQYNRDVDINIFNKYDAVLLGDIHNQTSIKNNIAYAGSLLKVAHGESDSHGILIWDLNSTITHKYIPIDNKYQKITTNKSSIKDKTIENITSTSSSSNVQLYEEELDIIIASTPKDKLDMMVDLYRKFRLSYDNIYSNNWKILELEWMNIFCYGNNTINTLRFNDTIITVTGSNTSGKTSILNMILFMLGDKITERSEKNIINKDSNTGYIKLTLLINGTRYLIEKQFVSSGVYKTKIFKFNPRDTNKMSGICSMPIDITETLKLDTTSLIKNITSDPEILTNFNLISNGNYTNILSMSNRERYNIFTKLAHLDVYDSIIRQVKVDMKCIKSDIKTYMGSKLNYDDFLKKYDLSTLEKEKKTILELEDNYNKLYTLVDNYSPYKDFELFPVNDNSTKKPIIDENTYNFLITNIPKENILPLNSLLTKWEVLKNNKIISIEDIKKYKSITEWSIIPSNVLQLTDISSEELKFIENNSFSNDMKNIENYSITLEEVNKKIKELEYIKKYTDIETFNVDENYNSVKVICNKTDEEINSINLKSEQPKLLSTNIINIDNLVEEYNSTKKETFNDQLREEMIKLNLKLSESPVPDINKDYKKIIFNLENKLLSLNINTTSNISYMTIDRSCTQEYIDKLKNRLSSTNFTIVKESITDLYSYKNNIKNKWKRITPNGTIVTTIIKDIKELDKMYMYYKTFTKELVAYIKEYKNIEISNLSIVLDNINTLSKTSYSKIDIKSEDKYKSSLENYKKLLLQYISICKKIDIETFKTKWITHKDTTITPELWENVNYILSNIKAYYYLSYYKKKIEKISKLLDNITILKQIYSLKENYIKLAENIIGYNKYLLLKDINSKIDIKEKYIENEAITKEIDRAETMLNYITYIDTKTKLDKYRKEYEVVTTQIRYNELVSIYQSYLKYRKTVDKLYTGIYIYNYLKRYEIHKKYITLRELIEIQKKIILHDNYIKFTTLTKQHENYKKTILYNNYLVHNTLLENISFWYHIYNIYYIKHVPEMKNSIVDLCKKCEGYEYNIVLQRHGKIDELISMYNDTRSKHAFVTDTLSKLQERYDLLKLFKKIFETIIPTQILNKRLDTFMSEVNTIFQKYTKYKLLHTIRKGIIELYVSDINSISRLSGYESVILRIALLCGLYGINSNRGDLLMIDESFDCIDENNFNQTVPELLKILHEKFKNVLIISHRDISSDEIYKKITVSKGNII